MGRGLFSAANGLIGISTEHQFNVPRISRRTADTTDETGKDTFKNETTNRKTLDRAVGCMCLLGGAFTTASNIESPHAHNRQLP